jgi:aconitate hydratase
VEVKITSSGETIKVRHDLSGEEIETLRLGGLINKTRKEHPDID